MLAKLNTFALVGIDAVPVEVEVDVAAGLPKTVLVGLPEMAVRESLRAFNGFDPDNMHKNMPAGFHPGAVKFYKEKGIGGSR